METETVFIFGILLIGMGVGVWRHRQLIKNMYIATFNMGCVRFGLTPLGGKQDDDERRHD